MTSSPSVNLYSQGGGTASSAQFPSSPVRATRAPATTDVKGQFGLFPIGQIWIDTSAPANYMLSDFTASAGTVTATWNLLSAGSGDLDTLDGDSGSATPTAGAITIAGTANEVSTSATGSTVTLSLPSAITAPGSLTTTTTLTATAGDITATDGNLVLGTAGNKIEIATGADASAGSATLTAGTVTVSTSAVTADSLIYISRKSIGATGAAATGNLVVGTVTAGTSFVINSVDPADATSLQATDVSVIDWVIIN